MASPWKPGSWKAKNWSHPKSWLLHTIPFVSSGDAPGPTIPLSTRSNFDVPEPNVSITPAGWAFGTTNRPWRASKLSLDELDEELQELEKEDDELEQELEHEDELEELEKEELQELNELEQDELEDEEKAESQELELLENEDEQLLNEDEELEPQMKNWTLVKVSHGESSLSISLPYCQSISTGVPATYWPGPLSAMMFPPPTLSLR